MGCRPQQLPELAETTESSTQAIRVSDQGWLVFTDQEQFISTMQSLYQDRERLESYDQQHGYTAYFNAWRAIGEEEYETLVPNVLAEEPLGDFSHLIFFTRNANREWEEQMQIDQPVIQFLANDKGLLQVGDSLKKFTYNWVVSVPVSDAILVNKLQATTDFSESFWQPYRSPITRSKIQETVLSTRAGINEASAQYKPNNLNLRRVWGRTTMVEASEGVNLVVTSETKHQRRIAGIWVGDEAPTLIHQSSGSVNWGNGTQVNIVNENHVLPNEKSTPSYPLSVAPIGSIQTLCDVDSFHGCGTCDGGATNRNCETNYAFD